MKTVRLRAKSTKIKQKMFTCEAQIHLKQISLMLQLQLHHLDLRGSGRPAEHSRSYSRPSAELHDKSFDGSVGLSKIQSRISHRKEQPRVQIPE